jgi:hypothetical protein
MKAGILVPLWSELVRTMICSKRVLVVSSLVAYLLATTSVQALHDHSGPAHHCSCCGGIFESGVAPENRGEDCCAEHADGESGGSHHHSGSKSCDESCFACRLLAVKGVAPTAFAVAPHITAVFQVEPRARSFFPLHRPSQPLSRGPPCC